MHEATLLHLSIEKAQSLLGWSPRFQFDKAVCTTGEWYQRVHNGEDAGEIMKEQLT
jgi:CDP-glucose 4,6-dehydratase